MKKLIIITLISFTGLLYFSCSGPKTELADADAEESAIQISAKQFKTSGMELGTIETKSFNYAIPCNGYINIKPESEASVSITLGGLISAIKVKLGDQVVKGQLLFTLESLEIIQLQQDYLETKAQLENLFENFKRQEIISKEKVGSEKEYLQAKSEYLVMDAKLKGLMQKLLLININPTAIENSEILPYGKIVAPISGSMANINFSIGDYVNPGDKVMEIINTNDLQLVLNVFERDALDVKEAQHVTFSFPELMDYTFDAEVFSIGKKIMENNGSIRVYCIVKNNKDQRLIPGMYIKADIIKNVVEKPSLPESAVIELDNQKFVLVLNKFENDVYFFSKTSVNIGVSYQKDLEIKNSNLNVDQQILINGAFNLLN